MAGLAIGFIAQRNRFWTMGSIGDVVLMRNTHLVSGVAASLGAAFATYLILGQVDFGFFGQPVAHSNHPRNLLGIVLAGLALALGGGCSARQLFLTGEEYADAGVFVLGMVAASGFAHNSGLTGRCDDAATGTVRGVGPCGMAAVMLGLLVCVVVGITMRWRE